MAKMNTMAVLSLLSVFVLFPLGFVLGIIALRQIKKTGESGKGIAIAGIVISLILFVFLTIFGLYMGFLEATSQNGAMI